MNGGYLPGLERKKEVVLEELGLSILAVAMVLDKHTQGESWSRKERIKLVDAEKGPAEDNMRKTSRV